MNLGLEWTKFLFTCGEMNFINWEVETTQMLHSQFLKIQAAFT